MLIRALSFCTLLILSLDAVALAAEPDATDLQKIVTAAADQFAKAFEARDAKMLAALFTVEAEYIDGDETVFHGRSAIEAEYTASFATDPAGTLDIDLLSIRPIAAGVLVEDGLSSFRPKASGPSVQTRYTATHVKQADGTWLLASVRELGSPIMTPHDRLEVLAWLVGRWREDVDGSVINTEWKWTEDGNFLVSDFSVKRLGDTEWKGTHRVGWDAERKQFRSWVFDSAGGAAEGSWCANEDGGWSVTITGIDPEGVRVSSVLSYLADGADAIVVAQEQRVRGGVTLPGTSHRVVRQPPTPGSAAPKSTTKR